MSKAKELFNELTKFFEERGIEPAKGLYYMELFVYILKSEGLKKDAPESDKVE